jgi:hypothetical protein
MMMMMIIIIIIITMKRGDEGSSFRSTRFPLFFFSSAHVQAAVPTRQPPVVATARQEKRSEHCHATVGDDDVSCGHPHAACAIQALP